MAYKKFGDCYVVSIARGEEITSALKKLCESEGITLGTVTGIGAAEHIELGYYKVPTREYFTKTLADPHEITALVGNITTMDGEVYLHLHITLGDADFQAVAGHLVKATVSGACEVVITRIEGTVERYEDKDETGLNLLNL